MDIPYLYIFLTPGCDPATHCTSMDTPEGRMTSVGVSDVAQACEVAAAAATAGTACFVELCGAFGEDGCRELITGGQGRAAGGLRDVLPGGRGQGRRPVRLLSCRAGGREAGRGRGVRGARPPGPIRRATSGTGGAAA